ncbi:MAG TPA: hypothetical protein RMH99_32465 [Sandaracinaceae bacterium LLY-WYZ-13_1]|nr:hypothetical protein [Sandaracinaceae bacterium LLY-WYZ-13_1]
MATRLVVARPYTARIRSRVFGILERCGLRPADDDVLPAGLSDDEVLARLEPSTGLVLLIPFHAHRDARGQTLNGLDLIRRLREERPGFERTPVLCPISNVGLAAASLMLSRYDEALFERVLFLHEDELDDADAERTVRAFLAGELAPELPVPSA